MARLFRKNAHDRLQRRLFHLLKPAKLAAFSSRKRYDHWLRRTIKSQSWKPYVRKGLTLKSVRWAYIAKLLNILIYELVSNRELFSHGNWKRVYRYLHVPIDSNVLAYISQFDSRCPRYLRPLKGMTGWKYREIQKIAREAADVWQVAPIWFESAYSADKSKAKSNRKRR